MSSSPQRDLARYLREQREHARESLRQLADSVEASRAADAGAGYLGLLERGLRGPGADLLQGLAKGLRVSADSLYERAGVLDERDPDQMALQAAILAEPVLTERQKRALLDIYSSFRVENARTAEAAAQEQPRGDEGATGDGPPTDRESDHETDRG